MNLRIVFILIALMSSENLFAQEVKDSINHRVQSVKSRFDSLQGTKNLDIDRVDSVNRSLNNKFASDINLVHFVASDSVKKVNQVTAKVDSATNKLRAAIDSLNALKLPTEKYTRKLDSLNRKLTFGNVATVSKISEARSNLETKISSPLEGVNQKINLLRNESGGQGVLPSNIQVPPLPDTGLSGIDQGGLELPSTDLKSPGPDVDLSLNNKLDVNPSLKPPSEVSGVSKQISGQAADVKDLTSGNMKAVELPDHKFVELQRAQSELTEGTQQIESLKSLRDSEEFKKQALAKGRQLVLQRLATQQTTLSQNVNKVSRLQRSSQSIFNKVKGLPKRPTKEKKPPFIERFVPGVTFQIQKSDLLLCDFNPTLRFRIKSIFSTGSGWVDRVAFKKNSTAQEIRVYGIRAFSEFTLLKSLSVRADVERLNAFVPTIPSNQDVGSRKQIWNFNAGLKKDFSFMPGAIGNVQFMYNLYNPSRSNLYASKFNVRFGFEFPLKTSESNKD